MRKVPSIAAMIGALLIAAPADAQTPAPCPDVPEELQARCGTLAVPLDRANPGLGTTQVAFAVLERRDAERPSLGTLVGAGGAGGPIIPFAPQLADTMGSLLERRELLLVDPRGTGGSDPIACRALSGVAFGLLTRPERLTAAIGACGRELGARAGLYGNAAVADDMDAVREALGIQAVDLWGDSYGAYLQTVYAARHPEHVRSILLSGAYPIAYDVYGLDKLAATRRAIRLVCRRTGACRGQAVLRDVARLAARLREDPVTVTAVAGDRRFRLRLDDGALASAFYGGGDPLFFGRMPAAAAAGLAGDLAPLRRLVETPALSRASALGEGGTEAAAYAAACHDFPRAFAYADPPAARRAAYERALAALGARAFAPFSPDGWLRAGFESPDWCLEWPDDPTAGLPVDPAAPLPDVPVLILAGDLDANTPTPGNREVAARFSRATVVELPNAAHIPVNVSPCGAAMARRFIRTLTVNPRACAGTGEPPAVASPAPVRAAQLPLVPVAAPRAVRRALGLVLLTVADMQEQAFVYEPWGAARALRGGRYALGRGGAVRLTGARVVRDARVSGVLKSGGRGVAGTLRMVGAGVARGRLRVRVAPTGAGRARGRLAGRAVDLRF
jgi:pimeloyl-ACP methyl ester carboxylesterase